MFQVLNLNLKNKFFIIIKFFSFFLIIYLFYRFVSTENFLSTIREVPITNIFFIFVACLFHPILITLRWFILLKNFSKIKFIDLLKNIVSGYSYSLILASGLVIDATKFIKIKKEIGSGNSLILVSIDKLIALFFKITFMLIFVIVYIYFYTQINLNYVLFTIFFLLSLIFLFYKIESVIILLFKKILKNKKSIDIELILRKIKKKIPSLVFANLAIQLLNTFIYFVIFLSLETSLTFLNAMIIVPIIDILGQFSFIIFGMKEISTVFLLSFFNINNETALAAALIYLFIEYLVIITLYSSLSLSKISLFKTK